MFEFKSRLRSLTDRERWRARAAGFTTKVKATQAVWFPPEPAQAPRKAAKAAGRTTKKSAASAARRGGSARTTKKSTSKKAAKASA